MIQIQENPLLFVYFLIQFSNWEVNAAEDFDMPNLFPFKNKINCWPLYFCFLILFSEG